MEINNPKLLILIKRLKNHRDNKEKLLLQSNLGEKTIWDAIGRITAIDHVLIKLEHLYQTGVTKEREDNLQ